MSSEICKEGLVYERGGSERDGHWKEKRDLETRLTSILEVRTSSRPLYIYHLRWSPRPQTSWAGHGRHSSKWRLTGIVDEAIHIFWR